MKKLQRGLTMLGKKSILERSILKASWNDEYTPPKTKYIQTCISALNSKGSIDSFALLVQYIKQITPSRWVYSCKILFITHISISSSDTCYDLSDYLLHDDSEFSKVKNILKDAAKIQPKDNQIIQQQTARLVNSYWKYIFTIAKNARIIFSNRYGNVQEEEECGDMIVIKDKSNHDKEDDNDELNSNENLDLEDSLKTAEKILEIGGFLTKLLELSISNLITLNMFEKYPFLKQITAALLNDLSLIYLKCKTFWQTHEKYFFKGVLVEQLFAFYEGLVKLTKNAKKIEFLRNHCRPCQILRLPIDYFQIIYEKNQKIELFYMQEKKKNQGKQGQDYQKKNNKNDQKQVNDQRKNVEEEGKQNEIENITEVQKEKGERREGEEGEKRKIQEIVEEQKQQIETKELTNKNNHNDEKDKDKNIIKQPTEQHKDINDNIQEAICIVSLDNLDTQTKDENNINNNRLEANHPVGVSLKYLSERHKYQRHFRQNSAASTKAQPASVAEIPQENEENSFKKIIKRQENNQFQEEALNVDCKDLQFQSAEKITNKHVSKGQEQLKQSQEISNNSNISLPLNDASPNSLIKQNIQNQQQLQDHHFNHHQILDTPPLDSESQEIVSQSNNNFHKPIHVIPTESNLITTIKPSLFGHSDYFQPINLQLNSQISNSSVDPISNPPVNSYPPLTLHNNHSFKISLRKKRTKGSQELDTMQQRNNSNSSDSLDKQTNEELQQIKFQQHSKVNEKSIFNQRTIQTIPLDCQSEFSKDTNNLYKNDNQSLFEYGLDFLNQKIPTQDERKSSTIPADTNNDVSNNEYSQIKGQQQDQQKQQQYFLYSSSKISKLEQEDNNEGQDDYSMVDLNTEENMSMCFNSDSPMNRLDNNSNIDQQQYNNTNFSSMAAKSLINASAVFQRAHSSVITQPNGSSTNINQNISSFHESSSNEYYSQVMRKKNKKTTFSKAFLTPQHKNQEKIPTITSVGNQQKSNITNNNIGMFYV